MNFSTNNTLKLQGFYSDLISLSSEISPESSIMEQLRALNIEDNDSVKDIKIIILDSILNENLKQQLADFLTIDFLKLDMILTNKTKTVTVKTDKYKLNYEFEIINNSIPTAELINNKIYDCSLLLCEKASVVKSYLKLNPNAYFLIATEKINQSKINKSNSFIIQYSNIDTLTETPLDTILANKSKLFEKAKLYNSTIKLFEYEQVLSQILHTTIENTQVKKIFIEGDNNLQRRGGVGIGSSITGEIRTLLQRGNTDLSRKLERTREKQLTQINSGIIPKLKNKIDNVASSSFHKGLLYGKPSLQVDDRIVTNLKEDFKHRISKLLTEESNTIFTKLTEVKSEIKNQLKNRNIPLGRDIYIDTISNYEINNLLANEEVYNGDYRKEIKEKGWKEILSAIRQPLFILMPLMMIFTIIAPALNIGVSKGKAEIVNENEIHITKLPKKMFRTTVINNLDRTFNSFGINDGPLNGLDYIEIPNKYDPNRKDRKASIHDKSNNDNQIKIVLKIRDKDKSTKILKYLNETILISKSTNASGYGAIGGLVKKLGYFGAAIIFGLLGWLVYTTKQQFLEEEKEEKAKVSDQIKKGLITETETKVRNIKQRWKGVLDEHINKQITRINDYCEDRIVQFQTEKKFEMSVAAQDNQARKQILQRDEQHLRTLYGKVNQLEKGIKTLSRQLKIL
ncbi:MAG: hypothetical protein AB8G11_02970 [Saprospiraceae bacterium]